MKIDHEIFSMVILYLIKEGQLSVSGKRMCIILVNCLEDSLPSKSVVRETDHARHDPIGLTGP